MIVETNNSAALEKKYNFYDVEVVKNKFEVHAIKKSKNGNQYLFVIYNGLFWWDADLFDIIDNNTPEYWINKSFGRFGKLKNKQYDFSIDISEFTGPKELIENTNFLFDIYEYPSVAFQFFCDVIKKYRNV